MTGLGKWPEYRKAGSSYSTRSLLTRCPGPQRAQYPLIKEYGSNYIGSWALWVEGLGLVLGSLELNCWRLTRFGCFPIRALVNKHKTRA